MKNCEKGDTLGFLKLQFVAKYQKIRGVPFGDKKIRGPIVSPCRPSSLIVL